MKKGLILILALGLFYTASAQETKIGFTNADYVLSLMPESKEVQSQVEAYEKQFSNSIQQKYQDFQAQVAEYQQNAPTMTEQVRATKRAGITRVAAISAKVSARCRAIYCT